MSGLFANSVDSLGTANLSRDLDGVQRQLESLDASDAEQEATDLLEQIKDLIAINTSLNELATRERRNPSVYPGSASASDIVHLQSVLDAVAATINECTVFAKAIQSSLNDIARGRNAVGFVTHETTLKNQSWYDETYQALKLRTEVLKTLCSAVHVLQHKNNTDENGNLSIEARSSATTLGYQIALVDAKLLATEAHTVLTVRCRSSNKIVLLTIELVAKRLGCCEGSNNTCSNIREQAFRRREVCPEFFHWKTGATG